MWTRQLTFGIITALLSFTVAFDSDDNTQEQDSEFNLEDPCCIASVTLSVIVGLQAVILIGVAVKYFLLRNSPGPLLNCEGSVNYSKAINEEEVAFQNPVADRISDYELWMLVKYAGEFNEEKKLKAAFKNHVAGDPQYGATDDTYRSLRSWKEELEKLGSPMNQLKELYNKCTNAGMKRSIPKLEGLRQPPTDVTPMTSCEIEHVLWQIGKQSKENITRLLEKLNIKNIVTSVDSDSGLKEIVDEALEKLKTWKEGPLQMNPFVILSLTLEELKLSAGDFFKVPEDDKKPLTDGEIRKIVHDATINHCKKILKLINSQGRNKNILIHKKPAENDKVLFNTYQMIQEWQSRQECSNYEKRENLRAAVSKIPERSESDEELFSVNAIKGRAARDKKERVEVAYELLMTDILPFAKALGVETTQLPDYKVQTSNSSKFTMGTVGLLKMLIDK